MSAITRLTEVLAKEVRIIIGAMSGMSMDGIDLALVRTSGQYPNFSAELLDSASIRHPQEFKDRLQAARTGSVRDACVLGFEVANAFADAINGFIDSRKLNRETIDAIGSHGQTLVHIPPGSTETASTLQVGQGSVIAAQTGLITVSNFRPKDMALGGHGAPFAPIIDFLLYSQPGKIVLRNNLGSISNVTIIADTPDETWAFDTGPANMPIDHFAKDIPGNTEGYDKDGQFSAAGSINEELLKDFLSLPYFDLDPPKSAGYDQFGPEVIQQLADKYPSISPEDRVATAVEFSAQTIATAYKRFILSRYSSVEEAVFSGGGIHNPTLMQRLQELLPEIKIRSMADTISAQYADAKEGLLFAILAHQTLSGHPGNVPKSTGAKQATVLGEIALP